MLEERTLSAYLTSNSGKKEEGYHLPILSRRAGEPGGKSRGGGEDIGGSRLYQMGGEQEGG